MDEPVLDELLAHLTQPSPATRAKQQVRALRANTNSTLQALDTHPHDQLTPHILSEHTRREQAIMQWGRKPPPKRCRICGKVLPGPPKDFWTHKLGIKFLWALLIAALIIILAPFLDWWALVVFPVAWVVSFSFWWSITVPTLLLLLLLPLTLLL